MGAGADREQTGVGTGQVRARHLVDEAQLQPGIDQGHAERQRVERGTRQPDRLLVAGQARAQFEGVLQVRQQGLKQPPLRFAEGPRALAAEHADRHRVADADDAAEHVAPLVVAREVGVVLAAQEGLVRHDVGADLRPPQVLRAGLAEVVLRPRDMRIQGVETRRVDDVALVGQHQHVARVRRAAADAQGHTLRIQQPAHALADVEPAAAIGSRLVDGADTVGKIALRIGQVRLRLLRC